ncbi:MAG TPA: hypothetical protein VKR41_07910 [Puia sp.]|nr:hypothetical protein [Puia sp.]
MRFIVSRLTAMVAIPAIFLVIPSCSKSKNNGSNGSMTASINGTAWKANYAVGGSLIVAANTFELAGAQIASGDTTEFSLTFYTPIQVDMAFSSDTASLDIQYSDLKTGALYDGGSLAGHSMMVISTYNTANSQIAGAFSGVLYNVTNGNDSITVSDGTFSAPFSMQ